MSEDKIRCPACRGAKKVPKLGGMIGECNTCKGNGTILMTDKPKPVVIVEDVPSLDLINAVADSVASSGIEQANSDKFVVEVLEPDIKIDGKKALYKRKKA